MATYWADYSTGSDANTGLSYAQAKKTWKAAIDTARVAGAGNTVNIVGNMVLENSSTTLSGFAGATDFDTGFGMRIQGTDSSGNAAMATLTFVDDATSVTALTLGSGANFIDIKRLYVNWSANSTACLTKHFCQVTSTAANGVRMRYNAFKRGTSAYGVVLNFSSLSSDTTVFTHNVVWEQTNPASSPVLIGFDDRGVLECNHNIFMVTGAVAGNLTLVQLGNNDANLTNHAVTFNTFYVNIGAVGGTFAVIASTDSSPFAPTPSKEVRNNILFWRSASAAMVFMDGNSTSEASWTRSFGYNLLTYTSGNTWTNLHPYERPWDPDNSDTPEGTSIWTGDEESTTTPFNALDTSWAWNFEGGAGTTFTLPHDFRVITQFRDNSSSGGVPGAVIASTATREIDGPTTLRIHANIGQAVTDSVKISNIGTGTLTISSITFSSASTTLTYGGVSSASLAAGASVTLPVTFAPTTSELNLTVAGTITILSDDLDESTFTVTVTGIATHSWIPTGPLPSTPVGPTSPGYFLNPSVAPGSRGSGVSAEIQLWRNTVFVARLATTVGNNSDTTSGIVQGTVHLVTNSGLVQIPGLNVTGLRKVYVRPEGGDVTLQLGLSTFLVKDGGCMLAANVSSHHTVLLSNASTIKDVSVHFFSAN